MEAAETGREKKMTDEMREYTTFTVTTKDGSEVEMAVIEEFEFEHKNYVVGALIEGDTINEDGYYIYRTKESKDDVVIEKITDPEEYQKVAEAFFEMSGEDE